MLIIAWEITSACNLQCSYCRASAEPHPSSDELSTAEAQAFIDDVESLEPMIIISGGEPLMRPDIFQLISYAISRGLRVSMATNGTLLTPEIVEKLKASGIGRVSISLDGAFPEIHDLNRGKGTFQKSLKGMELLRGNLDFQINMTVTRRNEDQIIPVMSLAEEVGAKALHFFFLVPTGRGREEDLITPEKHEQLLKLILEESAKRPIEIQVTCAPQYARICAEAGVKRRAGGCLAGTSFVFLSRRGEVYPCGYLPALAGSIREQRFTKIWSESPVLKNLRERKLNGKCGSCSYIKICGGCRARAFAYSGDYLGPDLLCGLETL